MPGRPVLHRLCDRIAEEAAARDLDPEEYVSGFVADGESVRKVAARFGVSKHLMYEWLRMDPSGRREELFQAARKASAEAHADRAGEVLEEVDPHLATSPMVQLANSRSNYHRWMAEVRDRDTFGNKPAAVVNVSLGALHLDALRQAGSVPVLTAVELPAGAVVEADVVEELNQ
jgi:transposase-like protein